MRLDDEKYLGNMKSNFESKKVLLLTYAFSPLQAAESFLSAKAFAKIDSYSIDVLTINSENLGVEIDTSLDRYTKNNFNKIYRARCPYWINKKTFKLLRYFSIFPIHSRISSIKSL